jgi:hypothetical protein
MESILGMAGRLSTELRDASLAERCDSAFEQRARELLMRVDPARLDLTLAVFLASIARSLGASPDALYGPGWSARIRLTEHAAVTADGSLDPSYDREWEQLMREVRAPLAVARAPGPARPLRSPSPTSASRA